VSRDVTPDVTPDVNPQRVKEFLSLLPLTMEIAGLPKGNGDRMLSADIMELRANNLKAAYKLTRQLLRDISEQPG
jgi:hypothetical protein